MAAVEVPQTLEYMGGQLNAALILEVENFTNWKKRKPEGQWTGDERKAANLDQRLKSLIMYILPNDQMNSDFQDSPDDEEDTRSSHEYLIDLEEEYQARALLAKSKRFFKKGTQRFSSAKATDQTECHTCGKKGHHKPELRPTKDFEAKYNKVKAKLALLSSSASAFKVATVKNKAKKGPEMKISMRKCDIKKPIWYLDIGCSRHMSGVKSYLHKFVEQPGLKVLFGDDPTCTTECYGYIKCNGIVFTKVAFLNGLKYNLISISQLYDAKYIVRFDEKRETIFNSNKEVVMIAPRVRDLYVLDMTSSAQESYFFAKASDNLN
ncbi:hypothetical protein Tco_0770420 [Tanacetum coccineum]|uniref:Retrovirus-related Pol polyprotein from transposon TNT 1-94-like beta-barrel domain-containing protein n=1 Tax=Tanacetum coccineum TaxID=301880 RepID=A0ABQ4ZC66_9ASTR